MRDYCELACDKCRVRKVFGQCPKGVVDDTVIWYVLDAIQIGYEEGVQLAEQAVEYALSVETRSSQMAVNFCRRN